MNGRTFGILGLIAVVLAAIAIVGQQRNSTGSIAGDTAGELFVPALADGLDAIDRIVVSGAGSTPLVTLARADGQWVVSSEDGYPAAQNKVRALLIALAEARIVEEKTSDPAFYDRLGVEPIAGADAKGVEIALTAADRQPISLILGESYGNKNRYARLADGAQSVQIDRDPEVARTPTDWLAPEILNIAGKRVQQVGIRHSDGEMLLIHKEVADAANFTVEDVPEGRELQYAGIANVTGNVLQELHLEAVARAGEPAADPLVVTEFRTFDGLFVTVQANAADGEDPWLTFTARFDAEQALSFATEPVDDESLTDTPDATPSNEADAIAEADAINARLAGWRFRIASYQYSQLTRHMDDLLKAAPAAE
jgi:Domain of unknown function (DUF4340)